MDIKEIKKELGIIDSDIAKFFGYKNKVSYANSARKHYIENGIVAIFNVIKAEGKILHREEGRSEAKKTIEILKELKDFIANTMVMPEEDVSGDQVRVDDINKCLLWLDADVDLSGINPETWLCMDAGKNKKRCVHQCAFC